MSQYHIPANYTDAGKLLGNFEIRNGVEAVAIAVPLLFLCFSKLPFSFTTNIIITMIVVMPISGFALIGIFDDCLTRFVRICFHWWRQRGILTYKGEKKILRKVGEKYGY